MSNALSSILSLFLIFSCFLFGTDLVMIQYTYSFLDSISIDASYLISKAGFITSNIKKTFLENYSINIYPIESNKASKSYASGFTYGYVLEKTYSPIVLSGNEIEIDIERYTIINLYN